MLTEIEQNTCRKLNEIRKTMYEQKQIKKEIKTIQKKWKFWS